MSRRTDSDPSILKNSLVMLREVRCTSGAGGCANVKSVISELLTAMNLLARSKVKGTSLTEQLPLSELLLQ
jgi:hypothetical protein